MKQILLFIAMTLLALNTAYSTNESQLCSANDVSYEQAVKALENKKFVFKANAYDDRSHTYSVEPNRNFVILEDNKVTIQIYESPQNSFAVEFCPSNFKMKKNKSGDVNFEMLCKNKGNSLKIKITVEKGSGKCIVRGVPINFHSSFVLMGELSEYNVSGLIRTSILQMFQLDR